MKIAICGHGRHGKDTFAKLLAKHSGLIFDKSTSEFAADIMWHVGDFGSGYRNRKEMWEDRTSHREEWAKFIWNYNQVQHYKHPSFTGVYMYADMIETNDLIVGIRNDAELGNCKKAGIIDLSVWVDASDRLPIEGIESNRITASQCDLFIDNNIEDESLLDLDVKAKNLAELIIHHKNFTV